MCMCIPAGLLTISSLYFSHHFCFLTWRGRLSDDVLCAVEHCIVNGLTVMCGVHVCSVTSTEWPIYGVLCTGVHFNVNRLTYLWCAVYRCALKRQQTYLFIVHCIQVCAATSIDQLIYDALCTGVHCNVNRLTYLLCAIYIRAHCKINRLAYLCCVV